MKFLSAFIFCCVALSSVGQDTSVDKKLGEEGKAQVEAVMGIYNDKSKTKVLSDIGNKLVSNLPTRPFDYQFYIVDAGEPNAFALPGGYVFFTRGILALANSEDELAGVMGHEVIHSNNRHAIKQQKKGILPGLLKVPGALAGAIGGEGAAKLFNPLSKGGEAIMASHSRKDEYEADELGSQLSAKSGYQPAALGSMLGSISKSVEVFTGNKEKPGYFSDHPYTPDRIEKITKAATQLKVSEAPKIFKSSKDFLMFVDGVVVGANPSQGVFKGDWFLHPDLNFKLNMPAKWLRQNTPSAVAAVDSSEQAVMMLEVDPKSKSARQSAESFAEAFQKKTGTALKVESKTINGSHSSSVGFVKNSRSEKFIVTLLWIEYEGLVYKITGGASPAFDKKVTAAMESFAPLTPADRQSITKRIIKVVEAKSGETLNTISARTNNVISIPMTAAINNLAENKTFQEGDMLKVVVEVPY